MLGKKIKRVVAATALLVGVGGALVVASDPASAQAGTLHVRSVGAVSGANCTYTFAGYSAVTNTVTAKIQGSIAPRTPAEFATNKTEFLQCQFSSPYYGVITTQTKSGTGPTINFQVTLNVPYDYSYTLCASGATGTSNAGTKVVPVTCVSG